MNDIVGQENIKPIVPACNNCDIWKQLCKYKDLEEQGKLIELPCKVGDIVWNIHKVADTVMIVPHEVASLIYCFYVKDRLGDTTFLTKEEAEAKLAELKGGEA